MDDFSSLLRQIPIQLLVIPLIFGVLYIVLLGYILRRGALRRRKRREEKAMELGQQPQRYQSAAPRYMLDEGNLPATRATPAAKSNRMAVPTTSLTSLPEPDFNMLVSARPGLPSVAAAALASITTLPEQEIVMVTPDAGTPRAPMDAVEVMRVWRDISDGSLIIQMGGQQYRTMNEIGNPDLTRRFTAVVRELWAMVGGQARASATLPAVENTPLSAVAPARMGLLSKAADEEAAKPNIGRGFARTITGQPATTTRVEKTSGIADLIEEFLQFKLSTHPDFNRRSVHIRQTTDGGVRIEVDGQYYGGISDVQDASVRDYLVSVMREWDARQ